MITFCGNMNTFRPIFHPRIIAVWILPETSLCVAHDDIPISCSYSVLPHLSTGLKAHFNIFCKRGKEGTIMESCENLLELANWNVTQWKSVETGELEWHTEASVDNICSTLPVLIKHKHSLCAMHCMHSEKCQFYITIIHVFKIRLISISDNKMF